MWCPLVLIQLPNDVNKNVNMNSMSLIKLAIFCAVCICIYCGSHAETETSYFRRRNNVLQAEDRQRTGGDLVLNLQEHAVDQYLMKLKYKEIEQAKQADDGAEFPPAVNFLKARHQIKKSAVFKFIQRMPKGAALHLHDTSMVSSEWIIKNVTYRKNLYMCTDKNNNTLLKFAKGIPKYQDCIWESVNTKRNNFSSVEEFDNFLEKQITIFVDDPEKEHANQSLIWKKFYAVFNTVNGAVCYDKVINDYYMQALEEFYEDNVQYMEFRTVLPEVYSIDGNHHDHTWLLSTLENATKHFTKLHPDFIGAKVINSIIRTLPSDAILSSIQETMTLKKAFPDFVIGYDLVGQEDPGRPLVSDIKALLYPSQHNIDLKFFFHAGETDWDGEAVDQNILDALLLNTSRLGHGYAIIKHPEAMRIARIKGIPLEVNPVSNQVLGLVQDLRNHPVAPLLASGFPLVVSSDDPGIWGAKGVSYDWYEIFMGPGGAWADLRTLKKLAMDSFKYSGLNNKEKKAAEALWQNKWNAFIDFFYQYVKF